MSQNAGSAPFLLAKPLRQTAPILLTSPHSGRQYDAGFLATTQLGPLAIRRSEDSFVDELFAAAPSLGVPLLAAQFPRAYCDVNREAWELDPSMFADPLPDYVNTASPRVHAGLGTIARIVGNGEPIYAQKLQFAEAQARVANCWQPFHDALSGLIAETLALFGTCLVIDCHSMPTVPGRPAGRADIVLGDGNGTSCTPSWSAFVHETFNRLGFSVRRNEPYAGGYITRHYGRPRASVQTIQVEVARGLYMHERSFLPNAQFGATQQKLSQFLAEVIRASADWSEFEPYPRSAAAE